MAKINNSEITKEIQQALMLDTVREKPPLDVADKLLPVLVVGTPPAKIIEFLDETANDSDKTITVPEGKQWQLLYGLVDFTTTATAGNRQMEFLWFDSNGNIILTFRALNVQVASTTERYNLGLVKDVLEPTAGFHQIPIPDKFYLKSGASLRFRDSATIDAAADDTSLRMIFEETDMAERRD